MGACGQYNEFSGVLMLTLAIWFNFGEGGLSVVGLLVLEKKVVKPIKEVGTVKR